MKKLLAIILTASLLLSFTSIASASTVKDIDKYVEYYTIDTGKQVVLTIENISNITISMTVGITYYDAKGKEIPTYTKDLTTFEAGRTAYIPFDNPTGYASYIPYVAVSTDYYLKGAGIADDISQSTLYVPQVKRQFSVMRNQSFSEAKHIDFSFVYFKDGKIVKVIQKSFDKLKPDYSLITSEQDNINYDSFLVNINEAYY